MVRDGDVGITERPRRLDHLRHGRLAVARVGVHLQITADLLERHQRRQFMLARQRDLVAAFAQLRWYPIESQRGVDFLLRASADALRAAVQPVFVQFQLFRLGDLAQLDVVRLRAGEILQRRTEAGRLDDSQVHLESAREPHRGAGVALRGDVCHFTELAEA